MQSLIKKARSGQNVYIEEVREAFDAYAQTEIGCLLSLPDAREHRERILLPAAQDDEEQAFVREYFYARIYNMLSLYGGAQMQLYAQSEDDFALCGELEEVFEANMPRNLRKSYGRCLNVADRINAAAGLAPFVFLVRRGVLPEGAKAAGVKRARAAAALSETVSRASHSALCGMDIGGTDIKLVAARNGQIVAVKEYDWNPAAMRHAETMLMPLVLLVRVMRAALNMPLHADAQAHHAYAVMMKRDASSAEMSKAASYLEEQYGVERSFDGIGVCFPDVVIDDTILGGEAPKTAGIRAHAKDYEKEFSKLRGLKRALTPFCTHGGTVRLAGDGSIAAYTAAIEQAYSPRVKALSNGVFAHTLGTDLGTGWLDETGKIPKLPLELYNCVLDLGDTPARVFHASDARSVNNINTGISGTFQRYASQSGVFRLALRYFAENASARYVELFEKGFVEEREGGIYIVGEPKDMRKPFLEHIMKLAEAGEPEAEHVFRTIGEYMGECWKLTEALLSPRVKDRVLFGRMVKNPHCCALICEGAKERCGAHFRTPDEELAYTPLMRELQLDPKHSVAQFGQAVGACYYSMAK